MVVVVLMNSVSNLDSGPSRGRDMAIEVTQTPQGIAFSANGPPAPGGCYILKRQ